MNSLSDRLRVEIQRGRVADTMLLLGKSHEQLKESALETAALLLETQGSPSNHPDFAVLDPDEMGVVGLKVEHIAERGGDGPCLAQILKFRPLAGGFRVIVLLGVERMTKDAQAALLKTAEEPPDHSLLVLTALGDGEILPALRSRCRVWRLPRRDRQSLQLQAAGRQWTDDDFATLIAACGSAEMALAMEPAVSRNLLAFSVDFQDWLRGQKPALNWLGASNAKDLAGQRKEFAFRLSAALGLASQLYAQNNDPGVRLRLNSLMKSLPQAISEIRGMAHPELLRESLLEEFLDIPKCLS